MNKLAFLSSLILLTAIKSEAQQRTTKAQEPPRKASKIIVLAKDSANTLLNSIALTLIDNGFELDRKDNDLKTITTKERSMPKGVAQTKIQAHINDTAIVFTSNLCVQIEFSLGGVTAKPTFDQVTYSGLKNSYMMHAWRELDAIAHKFGEKIIYSK